MLRICGKQFACIRLCVFERRNEAALEKDFKSECADEARAYSRAEHAIKKLEYMQKIILSTRILNKLEQFARKRLQIYKFHRQYMLQRRIRSTKLLLLTEEEQKRSRPWISCVIL